MKQLRLAPVPNGDVHLAVFLLELDELALVVDQFRVGPYGKHVIDGSFAEGHFERREVLVGSD